MEKIVNETVIKKIVLGLSETFEKERAEAEPYKELFAAGSTFTGLFRELQHQMMGHVLDACQVLRHKHGVKINSDQFYFLLALPVLVKVAENDAAENDGYACSVDKAYYILSERFKEMGNV